MDSVLILVFFASRQTFDISVYNTTPGGFTRINGSGRPDELLTAVDQENIIEWVDATGPGPSVVTLVKGNKNQLLFPFYLV